MVEELVPGCAKRVKNNKRVAWISQCLCENYVRSCRFRFLASTVQIQKNHLLVPESSYSSSYPNPEYTLDCWCSSETVVDPEVTLPACAAAFLDAIHLVQPKP